MRCAEVREELPGYIRDGDTSLDMRRHLLECADCRAHLADYQDLLGALGSLRESIAPSPAGLVESLVAISSEGGRIASLAGRARGVGAHVARNRAAYVGGAVALAGIAGAAAWRTRARRLAPA